MHAAASTDRHRLDQLIAPSSPADWRALASPSLRGRRVLITGAGGSIGSALAHAAAASLPANLALLDSSAEALSQVDCGLRDAGSRSHVALLGSVCDSDTLDAALAASKPEVIFHAAALKHVPLMERDSFAAIETNVFGTCTLAHAAAAHNVRQIVHVSTDKAVDPRSIMGASKRIAELMLLTHTSSTRIKVVRLCNVIGSQGSVLPLFCDQIDRGAPVTVTDPAAERYFLTLDETVRALLEALDVPSSKALLLPAIGPAVRVLDLAQHVIEARHSRAVIEFIGLRPGDKVSERLIGSRECTSSQTSVGGSRLQEIDTPLPSAADLHYALDSLRQALRTRNLQELLRGISTVVSEYVPGSWLLGEADASEVVLGSRA